MSLAKKHSITYVPAPDCPVEAKPASTVILIRETGAGIETYLMRRRGRKGAFAGAFVFPGGVLDPSDKAPDLATYSARAASPEEPDPALFMAAIRETFEEAGVLFADGAENVPPSHRADLASGRMDMAELAGRYGLVFRTDLLFGFSRWVTPYPEPRRFDANFFLAQMPEGQNPVPDGDELAEGLWITPAEAISRQDAGQLSLFPPTLCTLWELSHYDSFDSVAKKSACVGMEPILPQPFYTEDSMGVLLPNDPEYCIEGFGREARLGEPSRVVARNGRWTLL